MMYDKTDSETGLGDKKDTDKGQGYRQSYGQINTPDLLLFPWPE